MKLSGGEYLYRRTEVQQENVMYVNRKTEDSETKCLKANRWNHNRKRDSFEPFENWSVTGLSRDDTGHGIYLQREGVR